MSYKVLLFALYEKQLPMPMQAKQKRQIFVKSDNLSKIGVKTAIR